MIEIEKNKSRGNTIIEDFDGIRKDNSKKIFYFLLTLIIIDSIYCIWYNK